MTSGMSFGPWLQQRRKALDLTQEELAQRLACSTAAIRKLEAEERRPSKQIAQRLAELLGIPPAEQAAFVKFARGDPWAARSEALAAPPQRAPWRAPQPRPGNLPAPLTPLIGRERETAEVREILLHGDVRLLTLVGPPGIGKTRLALRVAAGAVEDFDGGIFFVPLARLRDPGLLGVTVAQALGIGEVSGDTARAALIEALREKHLLLLLDSFERVVRGAALVPDLLTACPNLKILATSRAALNLRGERLYLVPPLALPEGARPAEAEDPAAGLAGYPAIALFVERAQAVMPEFVLTPDNAAAVLAICAHLDGLPLAIELIAARSKLLPPRALLARLEDRFVFQADGLTGFTTRHRTLDRAIGWSYDLLDADEQALFARLAVFMGGWTLEAAEEVCASIGAGAQGSSGAPQHTGSRAALRVFDGVTSLLDKSLIRHAAGHAASGEPRFTMLETIRRYAWQRLMERGEAEALRRRHGDYFAALAEAAEASLRGPQQLEWLDRLESEHDNLRAALGWAFDRADTGMAPRLAGAMCHFWAMHGHLAEGRHWAERALALSASGKLALTEGLRVKLVTGAASLAYYAGDNAAALARFDEGLAFARAAGDRGGMAFALDGLGAVAANQGDFARAEALAEQSLALSREIGDRWLSAITLISLGELARLRRDHQRARAFLEESLVLLAEVGDRFFVSTANHGLGQAAQDEGRLDQAESLYKESLAIGRQLGYGRAIAAGLEKLAGIAALRSNDLRAARLFGAAEALRQAIVAPMGALDRDDYDRTVALLRSGLDPASLAAAWAAGHAMSLEQALEYALAAVPA